MLQLKDIVKDYIVADNKVHALKGVNVSFRKSEFVSILGPSGCGKTTLLNIIGGLDHYTSGDLIINGVSTKQYGDRDWDNYRNHSIGFVFQSYNLIPHQTVLENVELALNISGVDKKTRVQKAKDALDKVGLKGEYNKKPNQLSGGQCQRVAIARALVSDPEILLADEPTGALDTVTSVQIMDLIKEISKERLVIMVTHNPELAEKYSTRIVRLLDGNLISDSNPYEISSDEQVLQEDKEPIIVSEDKPTKKKKSKKAKLSFWSAFKLSARNLKSKFKRTLLVCVAGSIGITGVASVLAVSTGIQNYINKMQDDMLSGNPITISESTINLDSLTNMQNALTGGDAVKQSIENGKVNVDMLIDFLLKRSEDLTSLMVENDITQEYVDYVLAMPKENYAAISRSYGIDITNNVYTNFNFTGQDTQKMSLSAAKQIYTTMLGLTEYKDMSSLISTLGDTFMEVPNSQDYILSQYEFLTSKDVSKFPTNKNEIMIVVNDEQELSDLLLAQLGYYSQDEFFNLFYKSTGNSNYDASIEKTRFTFDELIGKQFTYYPNDTVFTKLDGNASFPFTYSHVANSEWQGIDLTVTAILKPKKDLSYGTLSSGFYYTEDLTNHILANSKDSQIANYFIENNKTSIDSVIFNGVPTSGVLYKYSFHLEGKDYLNLPGIVGTISQQSMLTAMMGGASGGSQSGTTTSMPIIYNLSLRNVGGVDIPNNIKIYPVNFEYKDKVIEYLKDWNENGEIKVGEKTYTKEERAEIVYTDTLSLVIGLINNLIDIVTTALICFTSLSLLVSTVMISIITYVSVIERVKEIGVIRSLGGRKRDVSNLFVAETFIIGGSSGIIGVSITYLLSFVINLIVNKLATIGKIAQLSITAAFIMISISIVLTLISGLVPAKLAAKKDPVDALRSE